jgi:hypothetical protein
MLFFLLFNLNLSHAFFKEEKSALENEMIKAQKKKLIKVIQTKNETFFDYFPRPLPSNHNPSTHNLRDRQIIGFQANQSFLGL